MQRSACHFKRKAIISLSVVFAFFLGMLGGTPNTLTCQPMFLMN